MCPQYFIQFILNTKACVLTDTDHENRGSATNKLMYYIIIGYSHEPFNANMSATL